MKKALGVFTVLSSILIASATGHADENVKLLKATGSNYEGPTYYSSYRSAVVKVKNLGYEKKVNLFIQLKNDQWIETLNGKFDSFAEDGFETWKIDVSRSGYDLGDLYSNNFVVKYVVNGQTYWDNNDNNNYYINTPGSDIILGKGINILVDYAYAYKSYYSGDAVYFYGYIAIRNIAYEKKVNVVYTTDNWATTKTVAALFSYGPFTSGIENWRFSVTNLPSATTTIEYAISYTVAGKTYWDNNGGKNYKLEVK